MKYNAEQQETLTAEISTKLCQVLTPYLGSPLGNLAVNGALISITAYIMKKTSHFNDEHIVDVVKQSTIKCLQLLKEIKNHE